MSRCVTYTYLSFFCSFFFFNAPATTEIYTLSLHDALPISPTLARSCMSSKAVAPSGVKASLFCSMATIWIAIFCRSEEHTSELQSHSDLVCRLLLEKKKKKVQKRLNRSRTDNELSRNMRVE